MSSLERVLRAIDHQETDRLPRGFRAEGPVVEELLRDLGLHNHEQLEDYFKVDMARVRVSYRHPYTESRNVFGAARHINPLAEATTVDEIAAYPWPDPDCADIESFRKGVIAARKTGRAVVASTWGSIFGESYRLMGMDGILMAMALYPETAAALIGRLTDFFLEVERRAFRACEGLIDLSYHGNDFGSQRALLFRRSMFQEFFAPNIKRLLDQAKSSGLRTMYHSCGSVREIIPDLIDCGVDVLDPVQVTAEGMDPKELKERFGSKLCFHGAISAQEVLPLGSQDQIRAHVKEVCEIMRPGGGYIFVSDQAITSDTPPENVLAMYEAIDQLGY